MYKDQAELFRRCPAGDQGTDGGRQVGGNGHHRDVFPFARGFDFGELFVLGLLLVMRDRVPNALFVPARRKFLLAHRIYFKGRLYAAAMGIIFAQYTFAPRRSGKQFALPLPCPDELQADGQAVIAQNALARDDGQAMIVSRFFPHRVPPRRDPVVIAPSDRKIVKARKCPRKNPRRGLVNEGRFVPYFTIFPRANNPWRGKLRRRSPCAGRRTGANPF